MNAADRKKRELTQGDFDNMSLPKDFWGASWSFLPESPAKKILYTYLSKLHEAVGSGDGLLISGPSGSAKSYMSSVCAKAFRKYEYSVYFAEAQMIQESGEHNIMYEDDQSVVERCKSVDILIVDKLGDEMPNVRQPNFVKEIVNHRKSWRKVVIANTVMNNEEMIIKYTEDFVSRACSCMLVVPTKGNYYEDQQLRLKDKYLLA